MNDYYTLKIIINGKRKFYHLELINSMIKLSKELINKYDIASPRYTSYPPVTAWNVDFSYHQYEAAIKDFQCAAPISLYIHIPFCQKRCLYCACNVIVRKKKPSVGDEYLMYLEKEISLICENFKQKPVIKQIHIGGGTPTYLSSIQINRLSNILDKYFNTNHLQEKSIEIDPRHVEIEYIYELFKLGFNRLSFGIQDVDDTVQQAVGRVQSYDKIASLIDYAQSLDFQSINCDLIYGLPNQTNQTISETITKIISLRPNRIALYSFAYVPWIQSHQKLLNTDTLPDSSSKISLFLHARETLLKNGYIGIAMDHFALKNDDLAIAYNNGKLKRNFMGYSTQSTVNYLGLGVSSIGYITNCFSQNTKNLKKYYADLDNNRLPVEKGYALSQRDIIIQWVILTLMCQFYICKHSFNSLFNYSFDNYFKEKHSFIIKCEEEGLIYQFNDCLSVTDLGRLFIRNICMGFDDYLQKNSKGNQFSKAV